MVTFGHRKSLTKEHEELKGENKGAFGIKEEQRREVRGKI